MNSFLKWAGSKRRSLPTLIEMLPRSFDRYVEPFAGSACLFFAVTPKAALLSDINAELVGSYLEGLPADQQDAFYLHDYRRWLAGCDLPYL